MSINGVSCFAHFFYSFLFLSLILYKNNENSWNYYYWWVPMMTTICNVLKLYFYAFCPNKIDRMNGFALIIDLIDRLIKTRFCHSIKEWTHRVCSLHLQHQLQIETKFGIFSNFFPQTFRFIFGSIKFWIAQILNLFRTWSCTWNLWRGWTAFYYYYYFFYSYCNY